MLLMAATLSSLGPLGADPARASRLDASARDRLRDGRALWVKRDQLTTPERIVNCIDEAAEAGINVLFVQVRGKGDAWYESDIEPHAELLDGLTFEDGSPFDPLDVLIRRAHARGIQVHAWLNVFMIWNGTGDPESREHVLWRHPDWVAMDSKGRQLSAYTADDMQRARIEGVFLASANPAVRRHLRHVALEVAQRYPVDGIHLDYIRNPLVDVGYDRVTRAAFAAEKGVDPWKLARNPDALAMRFGREGLASLQADWKNWRADQVTRLVKGIRADLDSLPRPVALSAAVFPNCQSAPRDVGQDWMTWCRLGLLDLVVPMMYSPDTGTVLNQLRLAQRDLPLDVVLYAGLAVYNQPMESVVTSALQVQKHGADGVCFFPYDTLAERPGSLKRLAAFAFGLTEHPRGGGMISAGARR